VIINRVHDDFLEEGHLSDQRVNRALGSTLDVQGFHLQFQMAFPKLDSAITARIVPVTAAEAAHKRAQ
jgi:hypothetical protein